MTPKLATNSDEDYMQQALALADEAADAGEVPVGAVLVAATGVVLAAVANAPIGRFDPTAHAEILALRTAAARMSNYRLPGTTLYVTLEPCPMCAGALVHARIARLVYGASDAKGGACGSIMDVLGNERLNHRVVVQGGVLADAAGARLRAFFKARR